MFYVCLLVLYLLYIIIIMLLKKKNNLILDFYQHPIKRYFHSNMSYSYLDTCIMNDHLKDSCIKNKMGDFSHM